MNLSIEIDEIESIEYIPYNSKRYDISVEDNNNFFANDILIHNCQNMGRTFSRLIEGNYTWSVTEKLDGTSFTAYLNEDIFGVCSRNYDLFMDTTNVYWKIAIQYRVEEFLRRMGGNFAIQGEIIGEGIQGNPYKLKDMHLYIFDVYDIDRRRYLKIDERLEFIGSNEFNFVHAPIINPNVTIDYDRHTLLETAEIKSILNNNVDAEGVVYKCIEQPEITFKCISNVYLMRSNG